MKGKLADCEREELRGLDRKAANSIMMSQFPYKKHRGHSYSSDGQYGMFTSPEEIDRYFDLGGTLK